MNRVRLLAGWLLASWGAQALCGSISVDAIREESSELPLAAEVDVLVVGGSSGGVAAAAAASRKGASVFLIERRPYLGGDLCGTYRIWLEPDEVPESELEKVVFSESGFAAGFENPLRFLYVAEPPASERHPDLRDAPRLNDGQWNSAAQGSVQYDGDVSLTLDLGAVQAVRSVHLLAYQRKNDFEVAAIEVSKSKDLKTWTKVGVVSNDRLGEGSIEQDAVRLSLPLDDAVRYLRVVAQRAQGSERVLLAEVVVEGVTGSSQASSAERGRRVFTPMQLKRGLDRVLLDAEVPFLYGCYAAAVLVDEQGTPAGVVVENKSGRQVIRAKVTIDATERASLARMTTARFRPYPDKTYSFRRVVIGGEPVEHPGVGVVLDGADIKLPGVNGRWHRLIEYEIDLPMADGSWAAFAEAEQVARDWTWTSGQVDSSEVLFQVPPDPVRGRVSVSGAWPGADRVPLEAFRPRDVDRIYILGGCADLPRAAAGHLLRPLNLMRVGVRVGEEAVGLAREVKASTRLDWPSEAKSAERVGPGEVTTLSSGVWPRQSNLAKVALPERIVPVLGEYDVVVIGGGTGGAPAGIGAGRQGGRTLVVEYLHGLGGVGTLGLISSYYHGNRVGFTAEVDRGVATMDGQQREPAHQWNVEWKMEWYRQALRRADVDIWFGVLGCGAVVDQGKVKGVLVATPAGCGVVLAHTVVDSTGNAAIAAAAGAECTYTDGTHIAVQGTGLPPRDLGAAYVNTDFTFVDESDVTDLWRVQVMAREKYRDAYDLGQLVDTRERRQIVGDFTLTPLDMLNHRTYPDTVVISLSNFDTHGFTVHPMFLLRPPDREDLAVRVPYRCLLPKGLDGILVTGLGASAHRDAMPVIRMQADIQNQGYAAGVAAAMTASGGQSTRELDVKALQSHLVAQGILPEAVLAEIDSFPLPEAALTAAAETFVQDYQGLEVLLTDPDQATQLIRGAYLATELFPSRLVYAHLLGMLGDSTGVETLLVKVRGTAWDEGWDYTGMGQFGASISPLDSLIIALSRTGDPRALEVILRKVEQLDAASAFSHFRAVAVATETLADPAAASALARLLQKPGVQGHAVTTIAAATEDIPVSRTDTTTRNRALKELVLARALFRCGDQNGLAREILEQYANDLHGHYARHAHAILNERNKR